MKTIYWVNATLLVLHEIDAAHWREWELFGLPGGEPAFLLLHLPLILLLVWGYDQVALASRGGAWVSLGVAAAGLLAAVVHAVFLAEGHPEFLAPASIAVLVAIAGVSLLQAATAANVLRVGEAEGEPSPGVDAR